MMHLVTIEVRTMRHALVCSVKRYLSSLDLVLKEYPPERGYVITITPEEVPSGYR